MNLATDPWIPIVHRNGQHQLVSLCQVFAEGKDYTDLAVRPHERIALMRLLIAIAQAALDGPEDIDGWDTVPDQLPNSASEYLKQWMESFELFHPQRPFLQINNLTKPIKEGKAKNEESFTGVGKLDFALATGNNTTLFDHEANGNAARYIPLHTLPLILITFLCFSPSGKIAWLDWNGKVRPIPAGKNEKSKNSSINAPCTPFSMLHTFVRQPTLFETLHVNLLTQDTVREHWGLEGWGKPIWERIPSSWEDSSAIENATRTYLGRLMPLSRFICLQPSGASMLLGNGLDYPSFPNVPAEPSATVTSAKNNTDRSLLGAREKALWRELSALIVRRRAGEPGGALTLRNIPENRPFDIWVGAFLAKQASIEDTAESVLHVPTSMQREAGRGAYYDEVKFAENIGWCLGSAVETWRKNSDGGWEGRLKSAGPKKRELCEKLHTTATRHYWTSVEKLRPLLLAHIETLGSSAEAVQESHIRWRKAVKSAAFNAYRLACGQETPRQVRAYALGWRELNGESAIEKSKMKQETI